MRVAIALSLLPMLLPLLGDDPYRLASVLGLVGGVLLCWQTVLGNRWITARVLPDRAAAVALHTWLGIAGGLAILLHPLVWRVAEGQPWSWLWTPDLTAGESRVITLGRVALLGFVLVWLSSTLARGALRYGTWRRLHLLSYPTAALAFAHGLLATGVLHEQPLLYAYWCLLAAATAAALVVRLVAPARAHTVADRTVSAGVTRLTLDPVGAPLPVRPGAFYYLRRGRTGPAHPFSVVDGERLTFAAATVGPFTRGLAEAPVGARLHVDGPYGTFGADLGPGRVVALAGGIGITPFLGLDHPDLHVFHLVRRREELVDPRFHPIVSGETGRIGPAEVLAPAPERVLLCGSARFVDGWERDLRRAGFRRITAERFE
jgi:predicted ferric reductase